MTKAATKTTKKNIKKDAIVNSKKPKPDATNKAKAVQKKALKKSTPEKKKKKSLIHKWTPEEDEQICTRFKKGDTFTSIAKEMGISPGQVSNRYYRLQFGVGLKKTEARAEGKKSRKKVERHQWTPQEDEKVLSDRAAGKSFSALAEELGLSQDQVNRRFNKLFEEEEKQKNHKARLWTAQEQIDCRLHMSNGRSAEQIAIAMGIHLDAVRAQVDLINNRVDWF